MTSDELNVWARKMYEHALEPQGLAHPVRFQRIKEVLAEFQVAAADAGEPEKPEGGKKKGLFK